MSSSCRTCAHKPTTVAMIVFAACMSAGFTGCASEPVGRTKTTTKTTTDTPTEKTTVTETHEKNTTITPR